MDKACCFCFAFAVILLVMNCKISTASTSLATDESALVAFKSHITSDPYQIITTNWTNSYSTTTPSVDVVCNWIGVICGSRHHRVTALNVSRMNLSGTIPTQLGSLSFLVSLDLRYNFFNGTLPHELSLLHRLRILSLAANKFAGDIPSWLPLLSKLQILNLRNNSFTGLIPKSLSNVSSLQFLDFSYNSLHGGIPEELGGLRNLQAFGIQFNYLSGVIPAQVFNMSALTVIALRSNALSGTLPIDMCTNLPSLQGIYLSNNQLRGQIPLNLSGCSQLQQVSLSYNSFSGRIPEAVADLNSLRALALGGNNFTATLPREIGHLTQLEEIGLEDNVSPFAGSIPHELFNVSTLRRIVFYSSSLSGTLPTNMCYSSPALEQLFLGGNKFSGEIPTSISNCSNLRLVDLSANELTGSVPLSLGNLRFLDTLYLSENNLTSDPPSLELRFITSLTNCRYLENFDISLNPLQGIIPASIGNFSSSLQVFTAQNCKIKGSIPPSIGNLSSNFIRLFLSGNELSGSIPLTLGRLRGLQGLNLQNNSLRSSIPESLCDLHSLNILDLSRNELSGPVLDCLGNMSSLRHIVLYSNMLTSSIPSSLWRLKDLLELEASSNSLTGTLPPEIGNLVSIVYVYLSSNQLSGSIPSTVGNLQNLVGFSVAHNRFQGSIPVSVGSMISLEFLDLSYNNLSGSIPKSLEALQSLTYINVSFNALSGEIPTGGSFRNFTIDSFKGNEGLCGNPRFQVPLCPTLSNKKPKSKRVEFALFILAGVVVFSGLATFIFIRYRRKRKAAAGATDDGELIYTVPERISYYEILEATQQFNESNLLGNGSFGHVYRGVLRDGKAIAVKVFNLESESSFKSFDVECQVLRSIRHRNLIKVVSSCSNEEFRALVLEYMPKGNLDKWLYSHNYCLNVMQRLNIMIDVASALEYLHHGYSTPVVHCDLKPSNVLLDEDMTARVTDFGIAKLLGNEDSTVVTKTLATFGYIAPEYGLEGLVSTKCDSYSYGVMLMETFTRRRPSDDMFDGDSNLKSWIESSLPHEVSQVVDANLLMNLEEEDLDKNLQCVSSILELALTCSSESPTDRINMKEALAELQRIKRRFSKLKSK